MQLILDKLKLRYSRRNTEIVKWKDDTGGKVIGCLPMYFPEEFVHAAGLLPVTLFGDDGPIAHANRHLMTNACGAVRGTFEDLLLGKYDDLDGVAAVLICDQVRFFFQVWSLDHEFDFFHQMWRPFNIDQSSRPFLLNELKRLKSALEEFTGNAITPDKLCESIRLFNETRSLMRALNDIRKTRPGLLKASDLVKAIAAGMIMPKEEYNSILKELITQTRDSDYESGEKPKVMVCGHPCGMPEEEILDLIEEMGAVIVGDDFFTGSRYFSVDVPCSGDPVEAYADFLLNLIPCTTYHYPQNWIGQDRSISTYGDYVADHVRENGIQGVILLREMYCDPFDLEFVMLKKKLEERNIVHITLNTGHEAGSLETQRTRIQGYLEMLNC